MKLFVLLSFVTLLSFSAMANVPTVSYTLGMSKPATHLFEVEILLDGIDVNGSWLELSLPVWRTGRYMILDLASGIVEFDVFDGTDKNLRWMKTDKSTWTIELNGATKVRARYKVFANELNLRTRGLNDERAFVDGTAVFMYTEKYRWQPITLTVVPFGNWHVTTGLDSVINERNKFIATNYDYFADCPLEIGNQKDFSFTVEGKEHVLSIAGKGNYDAEKMIADISKIVKTHAEFWGGLPYERFVFLLALSPGNGGGTEHINSCAIGARPFIFKNPDSYGSFLGLVSHEFFHTWNVKRLRPVALDKYDWTKENYTKELWIAEGTTSYYDDVLLVRSGFMVESQYLDKVSSAIESDRGRPGNLKQSLSECGFDAWIKYWKNTKQATNFETDYYSRGTAVSFILDMTIRQKTKNKHSLDDVMRTMYRRFPLGKGGYTNSDFQNACQEVAGTSLQQFFDDYVNGTKPLPWNEGLAVAGLELQEKSPDKKPWLGLFTNDDGDKTKVSRVIAGSPAYEAGLDIDDEILALNGYQVRSGSLSSRIAEMKAGDKVELTVFREERLREFEITLQNPAVTLQRIMKVEKPTPLQKKIYGFWLSIPTQKKEKK